MDAHPTTRSKSDTDRHQVVLGNALLPERLARRVVGRGICPPLREHNKLGGWGDAYPPDLSLLDPVDLGKDGEALVLEISRDAASGLPPRFLGLLVCSPARAATVPAARSCYDPSKEVMLHDGA